MVFHEGFYNVIQGNSKESPQQGYLRRELQTLPTCQATDPRNIYVCGHGGGGSSDPCRDSDADCSGLTHSCSCSGSTETSCSYCRIRTANAILCQVTGSSMTFVDPTFKVMTCNCDYIGNGQVRQNCFQPTPRPVPLPTIPPPVAVRTPQNPAASPSLAIPVQPQPVQPQFSLTAPPPVPQVPVPPPVEVRSASNPQMSCTAADPFNLNLSIGGSCDAMPNYPCSCSGSTETSCSYCQVRTFNAIRCQVTGSDVTFLDPSGALTTCLCQYRGNGVAEQYCYQEPVATAVVRAPSNNPPAWESYDD